MSVDEDSPEARVCSTRSWRYPLVPVPVPVPDRVVVVVGILTVLGTAETRVESRMSVPLCSAGRVLCGLRSAVCGAVFRWSCIL